MEMKVMKVTLSAIERIANSALDRVPEVEFPSDAEAELRDALHKILVVIKAHSGRKPTEA